MVPLVPKLRLGTLFRETRFRAWLQPTKQSFEEVRSQTEFGNEMVGVPRSPDLCNGSSFLAQKPIEQRPRLGVFSTVLEGPPEARDRPGSVSLRQVDQRQVVVDGPRIRTMGQRLPLTWQGSPGSAKAAGE